MFVRIGNEPRHYAWGSTTEMAALLGMAPSGSPDAELWLGAHPGSPSLILDPSRTGGDADLAAWIAHDPQEALGAQQPVDGAPARLPYLLKVLAAELPLSLQAHPSPEQAEEGFRRENDRGIPLDAPERNYRDPSHKPELIYALSAQFDALCGFRPLSETEAALSRLEEADASVAETIRAFRLRVAEDVTREGSEPDALRSIVAELLRGSPESGGLVAAIVAAGTALEGTADRDADTVRRLARAFPGDPGIVIALFLHRVTLRQGQALYLPAGNIHAYLHGLGIELMAASDNVLRGGLTPKHVDVTELLRVVQFRVQPVPLLEPERPARGVEVYRPDVPDFALTHLVLGNGLPDAHLPLPGPAIVLCTSGSFSLTGRNGSEVLSRGESLYVTPDEGELVASGAGTLFVATPNPGSGSGADEHDSLGGRVADAPRDAAGEDGRG
jgi:mannose-6-phosphate isomerase